VSVVAGPAGSALETADRSQIVIVDPPRKGLDRELAAYLCEHPPDRLLYVSCGLASLLEDLARLTSSGAMRLAELTAFNLMPFTEHVETVATLERR
jgi:23S rRNA (uracil1939-C5)-methyltransferase